VSYLTVTQLRDHVPTALSEEALRQLRDAKERLIERRAGPLGSVTETVYAAGLSYLELHQEPASIESVTDHWHRDIDIGEDEYTIRGKTLWRTRGTWGHHTTVAYTAADNLVERIACLVQLVTLAINFSPGMAGQNEGPFVESYSPSYLRAQNDLLEAAFPLPVFG
jgi:hypothetical protein